MVETLVRPEVLGSEHERVGPRRTCASPTHASRSWPTARGLRITDLITRFHIIDEGDRQGRNLIARRPGHHEKRLET